MCAVSRLSRAFLHFFARGFAEPLDVLDESKAQHGLGVLGISLGTLPRVVARAGGQ